jgi:nitrate/nitrite-specific signal transduction histidine kinase
MQLFAADRITLEQQERMAVVQGRCGVCCDAVRQGAVQIAEQACHCVGEILDRQGRPRLVVAVPLRSRGEISGVLSLFMETGAKESGLPSTVMDLLPALGDVLGLALENALLSEADFRAGLMLQRQLIANEVHDSLAQNLASVRMRTALLRDAVSKQDAARTAVYLAEIDESLALAQSRVREIITDFRSQMGATQLVPALENAIDELRAASGIQIDFDNGAHEPRLSAFEQVQVFYIAREALTNALKHAKAGCVRVALAEVGENIELEVEDDGVGLDRAKTNGSGHFGLDIMRERASRLGGVVAFEKGSGGGTRVRLRFPSRMVSGEAGT